MKDEELKSQINDIIEGEIQNGINDYLEAQEEKEDSGVGFVSDEAKELNVKVYNEINSEFLIGVFVHEEGSLYWYFHNFCDGIHSLPPQGLRRISFCFLLLGTEA